MLLNEDFFKDTQDWEEVASKQVLDSDGFYTDYTWYKTNTPDGEKHIFIFGDKDIYEPDEGYADWISYTEQSAKEWFDNYNGFEDDEDDEEYIDNLYHDASEDELRKMGAFDNLNESFDGKFCIIAITNDGKRKYYKDGTFIDNKADCTVFTDMDEARSEWFDIDKSKYKRVFIPKYDTKTESYDKYGRPETCENCGTLLTDSGECPKCDLGEERLDENKLKEAYDSNYSEIRGRVYDEVYDMLSDTIDNLHLVINNKVPAYNPSWIADDSFAFDIDRTTEDIVDDLMRNYKK